MSQVRCQSSSAFFWSIDSVAEASRGRRNDWPDRAWQLATGVQSQAAEVVRPSTMRGGMPGAFGMIVVGVH